jgi:hypothetical protein
MSIYSDIYGERLKITTIVHRDKLGKHIYQTILNPILEELYNSIDGILQNVGETMINALIDTVTSSGQGGGTYEVWLIDPEGKNVYLGDYTASAKGGPPFSAASGIDGVPATGTLASSLMWDIDADGRLIIGVGQSAGTEFESSFFKWGKIFVGGDIVSKTPVNVYAKALDDPGHKSYRPWLNAFIDANKSVVRQWIREQVGEAINKVTRRPTVKRALEIRIYWRSVG